MTHADELQEVRDRAAAYEQADDEKSRALARGAVVAAARHACSQGVSTTDVAAAAGVDAGELRTWL